MSTPLHEACKYSNIDEVCRLISSGADINAKDAFGDTPLHNAISNGRTDIALFLIKNGADPNIKGFYGDTSFYYARLYGRTEVARLLSEYKRDSNSAKTKVREDKIEEAIKSVLDPNSAEIKKQNDKLAEELEALKNSNRSSSPSFSIVSIESNDNDFSQHPSAEFESNDSDLDQNPSAEVGSNNNNGSNPPLTVCVGDKMAIIPCGHIVSHDPNAKFCSACGVKVKSTLKLQGVIYL